ncbi:MAG: hypothetical protein ACLPM3_16025, partial [Terracidiphilus sp.]
MAGLRLKMSQLGREQQFQSQIIIQGAPARDQFVMFAGLDGAPALNDPNAVGADDGLEAMGDDKRRAPHSQIVERFLHFALRFRIQRRGGLVE